MGEAALLQARQDCREVNHAIARIDKDILGHLAVLCGHGEILDAHAGHDAVDGLGILHWIELSIGVVVDVARVGPKGEVAVFHEPERFSALGTSGVEAAVRLQRDADSLCGGIVADLGDGLVVPAVELPVARAAQQQRFRPGRSAVVDQPAQAVDPRLERLVNREAAAVDRRDLQSPLPGFLTHAAGLLDIGRRRYDQPCFGFGRH